MAIPILNHLDLRNVSELQNATLHTTTRASASHKAGKIIYESAAVYVSDGSAWFDLSGDIKQVKVTADDGNSYDVTNGNFDFTISGDTGISTTLTSSTLEIDLDDTAVTPNSYGSATAIPTFTVDQQGRLTAAGSESIATALTIDDASSTQNVDLLTDDLQFLAASANEITTAVTKVGTDVKVTIGLPDDVTIGNNLTVTTDLDVDGIANLDVVDIDGAVDMASTLTLSGNADFGGDLDVDGTTNLDSTDIDGTLVVDGTNISLDSTSTLNIDNSNTTNGITIGTATSGVPITIGHTTSEVTVGDNLTVNGNFTVVGTQTTLNETVKVVENNTIEFEGTTDDAHEIKLTGGEPTADRVVALPDNSGTIALTTDITARQFSTLIGDASATTINILNSGASAPHKNHGLGADSTQFMIQLVEVDTGATVMADVARGTSGAIAITFASAPAANKMRVLINKIG
jgi:hypothetical protein